MVTFFGTEWWQPFNTHNMSSLNSHSIKMSSLNSTLNKTHWIKKLTNVRGLVLVISISNVYKSVTAATLTVLIRACVRLLPTSASCNTCLIFNERIFWKIFVSLRGRDEGRLRVWNWIWWYFCSCPSVVDLTEPSSYKPASNCDCHFSNLFVTYLH